jgi:hypothetical protein
VCGGAVGSAEQWDLVEARWSHETHGLREPFRSTECETGHGQFKDWPKQERDELMARLVGVLKDARFHGFASVVPVQQYKKVFPKCKEHDPFRLAVIHTIINMAVVASRLTCDVGLWFERGPGSAVVLDIFNSVSGMDWEPAKRLKGLHLETKELRLLQCADLVAREAFKHSDNLGVRRTRIPVLRLWDDLFFTRWNEKTLTFLSQNGGPDNVRLFTQWDEIVDSPKFHIFWKNF